MQREIGVVKFTASNKIVVVATVALALSTALIGYALRDGINFFRPPAEVAENPVSMFPNVTTSVNAIAPNIKTANQPVSFSLMV